MNKVDIYQNLIAIGFHLIEGKDSEKITESHLTYGNQKIENDIETSLVHACYAVDDDSRMLSLLFSWCLVHGEHIIANKFLKTYFRFKESRGECPWVSAFCAYMSSLSRQKFKKGIEKFPKPVWVGGRIQESGIKLKGAIDYLEVLNIFVPNDNIRIREQDVFSPEMLLKSNSQYRCRYQYGANYRADIIYAIQQGFKNPNQISKALHISYENVYDVFNDFKKVSPLQK